MKTSFLLVLAVFTVGLVHGQKTLNEVQTEWVKKANQDVILVTSDLEMSDSERLKRIQKAGRTQKRYGQVPTWPSGKTELEIFMDNQFQQCKNEIVEMTDWSLNLEKKTLDQKLKLINTIQIQVVEEQVQLLIPGSTPVQLTTDAINTVFGINIVEGVTEGKTQDAKDLKNKFKKLAESKELVKYINILVDNHTESLKMIDEERELFHKKMLLLKKAYYDAWKSEFTERGLEGAKLFGGTSSSNNHPLVGKWSFKDSDGYITAYQFNADKTAVQTMYSKEYTGWTWDVKGSTLYLIGGNGKKNSWEYRIDNNQLYLTVEYNGEKIEGLPFTKE